MSRYACFALAFYVVVAAFSLDVWIAYGLAGYLVSFLANSAGALFVVNAVTQAPEVRNHWTASS